MAKSNITVNPADVFGIGKEFTCPVCTTVFLRRTKNWGYCDGSTLVCSWTCLRVRRGEIPPPPKVIAAMKAR